MKIIEKVKVINELGLHIRPATYIVKYLQDKKSSVYFIHKKEKVDARSIMSLLMLKAKKNATITIIVEGKDAKEIMNTLKHVFIKRFGE